MAVLSIAPRWMPREASVVVVVVVGGGDLLSMREVMLQVSVCVVIVLPLKLTGRREGSVGVVTGRFKSEVSGRNAADVFAVASKEGLVGLGAAGTDCWLEMRSRREGLGIRGWSQSSPALLFWG